TLKQVNFANPVTIGEKLTITGTIEGSTLRLNFCGNTLEVTDASIASVNGRYFFFEQFGTASPSINVLTHRVWANSGTMELGQNSSQPRATKLSDHALGFVENLRVAIRRNSYR